MDFIPGKSLKSLWWSLPMSNKISLIERLARFQAELFDLQFESIGNLFGDTHELTNTVGPMVAMTFFWGDRGLRDVARGPFSNSREWLSVRLNLVLEEQSRILVESEDDDEKEDAEVSKSLAERLLKILPDVFPADQTEKSIIFHDDLSMWNLLVDQGGRIKALVDWECVSALPSGDHASSPNYSTAEFEQKSLS